jgi:hypothetical protein
MKVIRGGEQTEIPTPGELLKLSELERTSRLYEEKRHRQRIEVPVDETPPKPIAMPNISLPKIAQDFVQRPIDRQNGILSEDTDEKALAGMVASVTEKTSGAEK